MTVQDRVRSIRSIPLIAGAALTLIVGACGGAAATPAPTAVTTPAPSAAATAAATEAPAPTTALACAGVKVAFASTQKRGDQSVVDDMIANGIDAAKAELGADTTFLEALDPAAYEAMLTNLANAGNKVIVTSFNEMAEPLKAVAAKFPDVHFIQIYGSALDPVIPNLRTVGFRYDEGTYLAGILSGAVTKTNILGYEAGLLIPGINTDVNAFILGAAKSNPAAKVIVGEVGSFSDDAKAKQVVNSLYAQGADIVQGDGPVVGLLQAAKEKGMLAIHGAPGLVDQYAEQSLGVTFIYFGKSMFQQIEAACSPDFTGGHVETGLKDGTTGFYVPDQFLAKGDAAAVEKVKAAMDAVKAAEDEVTSGAFVGPFNPANP